MKDKGSGKSRTTLESATHWVTSAVMLLVIVTYAAALVGNFDPLRGNATSLKLEPLVFAIAGFSFAVLARSRTDRGLDERFERSGQVAEAMRFAKEKAELERESLEERLRSARICLGQVLRSEVAAGPRSATREELESAIKTAIQILKN